LTAREAATILELSEHHTWRMLVAYRAACRKNGAAALIHWNRRRRPRNVVTEETRQKVFALTRTQLTGFNHTHLTKIIPEMEGGVGAL
jgi:hypothetical protein